MAGKDVSKNSLSNLVFDKMTAKEVQEVFLVVPVELVFLLSGLPLRNGLPMVMGSQWFCALYDRK